MPIAGTWDEYFKVLVPQLVYVSGEWWAGMPHVPARIVVEVAVFPVVFIKAPPGHLHLYCENHLCHACPFLWGGRFPFSYNNPLNI